MVDVVPTVSVEIADDEPVTLVAGAEQVSPVGKPVTVQAKFTWPVKPPEGVTVSPVVPLLPAVTVIGPPLLSAKLGATFTVIETLVLEVILPVVASEPVTVAV